MISDLTAHIIQIIYIGGGGKNNNQFLLLFDADSGIRRIYVLVSQLSILPSCATNILFKFPSDTDMLVCTSICSRSRE